MIPMSFARQVLLAPGSALAKPRGCSLIASMPAMLVVGTSIIELTGRSSNDPAGNIQCDTVPAPEGLIRGRERRLSGRSCPAGGPPDSSDCVPTAVKPPRRDA